MQDKVVNRVIIGIRLSGRDIVTNDGKLVVGVNRKRIRRDGFPQLIHKVSMKSN